ncbi:HAD family hydrolase [Microbacterium gorillae]|uniref:capsular biosynthesis protein n=1 Tax=Microbacterium gorillae TaxID=1231063 RepID=UPI00058EE4A0|nr:capsular biosynthesis protein [Microbacterium gorillae]
MSELASTIVFDLDGTLTHDDDAPYAQKRPNRAMVERLLEYREAGFRIAIQTARNMRTFDGQIGRINAVTLPVIIRWLDENAIPYDEIHVGKPWCGPDGFYVDDRALRPSEFLAMSTDDIAELLDAERAALDNTRERTE